MPDSSPQPLKALIIGGGAREHALAWKLRQSPRIAQLFATDTTNPGLNALAEPCPAAMNPKDWFPLRRWCEVNRIGLVIIGPEEPLAHGAADALSEPVVAGGPVPLVFGPKRAGAQLEADKAFAKELMRSASIPTAEARTFTDPSAAIAFLESRDEPHVIKASGLAKGKGVFVPATLNDARAAIDRIMVKREFGDAGRVVVIEERLKGREVSVFALVDGRDIFVLEACQDHKRLGDNATGPNTGGMGSLSPTPAVDDRLLDRVQREVLVPTVDALRREGIDFRGVLYAGLMLTHAGPKVLEYNTRFGDPECQVLMRRWSSDLADALIATAAGRLADAHITWDPRPAVCVVLAAPGYPDNPKTGSPIEGIDDAASLPDIQIFHAGVKRDPSGQLITAGGRVLSVTAVGDSVAHARERAYAAAAKIRFPGKQVRSDIGTDVVG
jgi:phosphoribosylamine--glycine ligase